MEVDPPPNQQNVAERPVQYSSDPKELEKQILFVVSTARLYLRTIVLLCYLSHMILLSGKQAPEEKDALDGLSLGTFEYPADYLERKESAVQETLLSIKESIAPAIQDDTCDSSSDASYHAQRDIPVSNDITTTEHLVRAFSQCPALNLGFHCHPFYPGGDENWCFCPFGKKMRRWRKKFGIHVERECSGKKRMGPHALIQHMKDKAPIGRVHVDSLQGKHQIAVWYLECLYEGYVIPGYKHLAFYDKCSKEYNEVQKGQKRKYKRYSMDPLNETERIILRLLSRIALLLLLKGSLTCFWTRFRSTKNFWQGRD